MAALRDQLTQDATSLVQFVGSIADLCGEKSGASTHLRSSERFFDYIEALAVATKCYLETSLLKFQSAQDLLQLRNEISTLRLSWRFLHEFVKPALDADTLRLPTSLVEGLIARFKEIPRFQNSDFVIYHSDIFNYLNVKLAVFKKQADQISNLILGPTFPPDLSIIGIPYSQASSLFMNCLIPHEIGHYVFGELSLGVKLKIQIETELMNRAGAGIRADIRASLTELLTRWIEEVFCDSFAVRLVGFCFSIAFVELFDVSAFLDENGNHSSAGMRGETEFGLYPPDFLRLRQQVNVLRKDGWWKEVQNIDCQYVRVLEAANTLQDHDFKFSQVQSVYGINPEPILQSFFAVLPEVDAAVEESSIGLPILANAWKESSAAIEMHLEHGVVPSSLRSDAAQPARSLEPVVLLNSAYRFYVQSMPRLLSHIADVSPDSITDRVKWSRKVEMWTAKAIEDVLLTRRKAT